jgi:hypothetical protein
VPVAADVVVDGRRAPLLVEERQVLADDLLGQGHRCNLLIV